MDDPSDWPSPFRAARALDRALRCAVCGDLYHAAAVLSCMHVFCEECVASEVRCPICRSESSQKDRNKLRLLDEIATCFRAARSELLGLARTSSSSFVKEQRCLTYKECLICTEMVVASSYERHVALCKSVPLLPKLAFNMLSTKELKRLLVEYDLPAHGTRNDRIHRLRQYTHLYNANLSAAPEHRLSVMEIKRKLSETHIPSSITRLLNQ